MDDEETERPAAAPAKRVRAPRRKAKRRVVRWSARREATFLNELAQTSNVSAAIRKSGLSDTNVYRRRRKSDEFRAKWAAALREGFALLETMLLERALNGVEKPVWHGGKQVGAVREYSDRLALTLLTAHRAAVTGFDRAEEADGPPDEQIRADVLRRLSDMNLRLGGEG